MAHERVHTNAHGRTQVQRMTRGKSAGERAGQMGKYKATIIILNWNGLHLLRRCLPSVIKAVNYDGGGHDILVVDNGSTDGSVQFVLHNYPGVGVLPLPENRGFVGGYNAGLAIARQHLVVLLNNSAWVRQDFLTNLLVHFDSPDNLAVAPKIHHPPD